MYVANTSYMTTPWIVPWMHTQLGAAGPSAIGMAAALRALTRKGKLPAEKINVITFCGDLGGADMGLSDDLFDSFIIYQRRMAKEFKRMENKYGLVPIDANRSILEVNEDLQSRIDRYLNGKKS